MSFGFEIHEIEGSPSENFTREGLKVKRTFIFPWVNRIDFALGMMQTSNAFGLGPAGYPGFPTSLVESVQLEPLDDAPLQQFVDPFTNVNSYLNCKATVNYSPIQIPKKEDKDEQAPDGTWFTYSMKFSGEFLTLPARALKWPDEKLVSQDSHATLLIPITDHQVTWNQVPRPPWDAIGSLRGSINSGEFVIPVTGRTCPAETLLFEGGTADIDVSIDPTKPSTWKLTYTMKEKAITALAGDVVGWNHMFREDNGKWEVPESDNGPLYASGDLNSLFAFA